MSSARDLIEDGVRAERAGALERALAAYRSVATSSADPGARAEALTRQADIHRTRCDWQGALEAAREAQGIARKASLQDNLAEAIIAEANVFVARGDFETAVPIFQEIVATQPDARLRGIALQNIGAMRAQQGHSRAAERAFSESLGNFHKAGYARGEAIALNNLGRLALDSKDAARARPLLERALVLTRELEDSDLGALASLNLAAALCAQEELDRSQDLAMSALGYFAGCGNSFREIECLLLIGDINLRCDDSSNAKRCYELAHALAHQIGSEPEMRTARGRLATLPSK